MHFLGICRETRQRTMLLDKGSVRSKKHRLAINIQIPRDKINTPQTFTSDALSTNCLFFYPVGRTARRSFDSVGHRKGTNMRNLVENWVKIEEDVKIKDKFYVLFEQEIPIWPKLVFCKVATQCTYIKFTSTVCNTCEMPKHRKIIMSKLTSVHYMYFVQFTVKSVELQ